MKFSLLLIGSVLLGLLFFGCTDNQDRDNNQNTVVPKEDKKPLEIFERESKIPSDAIKVTPETDNYPPILYSDEWEEPVPVDYPISSKGAEDSAFITPDGNTLYFFFTPDVDVPPEKQLIDGVTGIYMSHKTSNGWSEPERVILNDDLSLDGCEFVQGNTMWFCSVRVGNLREIDIWTAEFENGKYINWQNAGEELNIEKGLGELHISADGNEIYYHNDMKEGKGGMDIWVIKKENGKWSDPENVEVVNSDQTDGWPFLSQDGNELWFTRTYLGTPAIYRSIKGENSEWEEPELILSQFAGEASLDNEGNLYFTHHFFEYGEMIEADIYVAYKKN